MIKTISIYYLMRFIIVCVGIFTPAFIILIHPAILVLLSSSNKPDFMYDVLLLFIRYNYYPDKLDALDCILI